MANVKDEVARNRQSGKKAILFCFDCYKMLVMPEAMANKRSGEKCKECDGRMHKVDITKAVVPKPRKSAKKNGSKKKAAKK